MAEPQAGIKIRLDTQELERQIEKLNDTFRGSFGEIRAAWELVGDLGRGIASMAQAVGELAAEADEAARASRQANELLVEQGRMRRDELEALEALNDARERALGISGEEQLELQTRLRLSGLSNDQLEEATRLSIGLASVTGGDLASSLRAVTQAYEGNFKLLERMGFQVESLNDLHLLSADLYKAAEAEAATYGGKVQRLNENFGHLREQLGSLISESPTVKDALGQTADGVRSIGDAIDTIRTPFEWYLQGLAKVVDAWRTLLGFGDLQQKIRSALLPNLSDLSLTAGDVGSALGVQSKPWWAGLPPMEDSDDDKVPGEDNDTKRRWRELQIKWAAKSKTSRTGRPTEKREETLLDREMDAAMARMLGDESFAAPSSSNAAFFSDPFFPEPGRGFVTDDAGEMRDALKTQYEETMGMSRAVREELVSLASTGIQGLAEGLSGLFVALAEGADGLSSLGAFFGGLISMLGSMLIQLGTAAVLAGALGTAVPLFAGLAGPQAVALGGVLIAGGIVMKGVGSLLGGGSTPGGSGGSAPSIPSTSRPSSSRRSDGSQLGPGGLNNAGGTVVYNMEFNAPIVGSPQGTARAFRDVLRRGDLRPAR